MLHHHPAEASARAAALYAYKGRPKPIDAPKDAPKPAPKPEGAPKDGKPEAPKKG